MKSCSIRNALTFHITMTGGKVQVTQGSCAETGDTYKGFRHHEITFGTGVNTGEQCEARAHPEELRSVLLLLGAAC